MTDTDSSAMFEDPFSPKEGKKKKKKKHKNKKKKRCRADADAGVIVDGNPSCREQTGRVETQHSCGGSPRDIGEEVDSRAVISAEEGNGIAIRQHQQKAREKKGKKKKKEKKKEREKKRKHSSRGGGGGIDDSIESSNPEEEDDSSCKHKCKRSKKKHKKLTTRSCDKKQSSPPTDQETTVDEKIVSSSAIEYYPEDLKHLQLRKNQEETVTLSNSKDTTKPTTGNKLSAPNDGKCLGSADIDIGNEGINTNRSPSSVANPNDETNNTSSNSNNKNTNNHDTNNITLLLFYQYVEPPWDEEQFKTAFQHISDLGRKHSLTGRMRIAREGLNCTLTGTPGDIRAWCAALRRFDGGRSRLHPTTKERSTEFAETEFKLTDDLPPKQRFPKLHAFEVVELVNYGLAGRRAPAIASHGGTHLEPAAYHEKMSQEDTVVIDVRNHYEANIGRFVPPPGGATVIDPGMRKSTEFPLWLDRKETKEMLRGKQVLMYCTGGVRCERASALLKQKIDQEEDTKGLGIKGVYQLQGGVDKYFKEFPSGGMWRGKNYTFDKRFAHAPPAVEALARKKKVLGDDGNDDDGGGGRPDPSKQSSASAVPGTQESSTIAAEEIMGKCEACHKPWDMYRGKRRCPTCGVPSLICRDCFEADRDGTRKLGRDVRCDLCVAEAVTNKRQLREREEREMKEYEQRLRRKLDEEYEPPVQRKHAITRKPKPNPERVTRLFLKNMCAKQMTEEKLLEVVHPARVTHIQWLTDRTTGKFYGSAFIEVKTAEDAGSVLALNGMSVLGRRIKVKYQRADEKDIWPIPRTEVSSQERV